MQSSLIALNIGDIFSNLWGSMGLSQGGWQNYVMLAISLVLFFLAIVKKYEPMLLLPIAFGMFLINLPGAEKILWGTYETPALNYQVGVDTSHGYIAAFADKANGALVYVREGYLQDGIVTFYQTLETLKAGEGALTMAQADFEALYSFNQIVQGIEYIATYSNAAGQLIYLQEGFLAGDTVTYYSTLEALINGTAKTMSVGELNTFYHLYGYMQGTWTSGTLSFANNSVIISEAYEDVTNRGLLWYLYYGVDKVIYPPLIFLGIGAMTDFGPLIANPKSMLIGAGAQLGIFIALFGAVLLGFTGAQAAAIAIIGGADGPTAIYVSKMLADNLVPTIAIAAYSYMALIPAIQKPIMRLLTTKKERAIRMKPLRQVSKVEKIMFPIVVTLVVGLLLPDAIPLLGMLMLGNLFRESGVVERLSSQAQNGLINTVTIFLGIAVGCKAKGGVFLTTQTLGILAIGIFAFYCGTIGGILTAKIMCKVTKGKINPLIGSAGVSAVPMAARISEDVGRETDPSNHLLMHAMGPNVAGVIGSALAAGMLLACFG